MNETRKRKLAAFISFAVAAGNIGVIAIAIDVGTFKIFMEDLLKTPEFLLSVVTGIISLIIGMILLTNIQLGKKQILTTLIISVVVFVIAAIQASIVLLFVLLWPWSLYRLYRNEIS